MASGRRGDGGYSHAGRRKWRREGAGTIITVSTPITAPRAAKAWRCGSYTRARVDGLDIEGRASSSCRRTATPKGGRPVSDLGPGTTAWVTMGARPSKRPTRPAAIPYVKQLVDAGYRRCRHRTTRDSGTPRVHTYLVGESEGRGRARRRRAARGLSGSGRVTRARSRASQGGSRGSPGGASCVVYSPELDVLRFAAGAPAAGREANPSARRSINGARATSPWHPGLPRRVPRRRSRGAVGPTRRRSRSRDTQCSSEVMTSFRE